jgi:hypothetical protein
MLNPAHIPIGKVPTRVFITTKFNHYTNLKLFLYIGFTINDKFIYRSYT